MLSVNLIVVGRLKEKWLREGFAEYQKRLEAFCRFSLVELEEYRLPENPSQAEIDRGLEAEADAILQKSEKGELIALCIEGKTLSSSQLADQLQKLALRSSRIHLVIGGSFGLAPRVKERAALRLSVSPMTFPHQLFRVMLMEQLYRAFSINAGTKYHK